MISLRYYITTPIYYVNDVPHIGHAYTTLACDVLARFMRLDGHRVHFLTGTDEHGQKVDKSARAAGMDSKTFTDKVSENFRVLAKQLNISNDDFIRTTEPRHIRASQAIWQAIAANKSPKGRDNIYLGKYAGWYAVRDEAFFGEDEITTGPSGKKFAPSGAEVEWVEEPSYFFRLSDWQDWLLEFYERNPACVGPNSRRNEVVSFVRQGLEDLSISRTSFSWGVPVPDAPGHIIYVWLDALTNYLTAVGYPDVGNAAFQTFWPADLHMVGKDIVRFHAVYWPAFLKAAGVEPPRRVFAHGWWTVEGQKMSKSLGNVIAPADMIDKYGLDPVRYFLLREVPFGQDGDFSQAAVIRRINKDLANDLGNLVQRVLSLIYKNCGAAVPTPGDRHLIDTDYFKIIVSLLYSHELLAKLRPLMKDQQAFHLALDEIWLVIRQANIDVDKLAPWALKKTQPDRMASGLYLLAEVIRHIAILISPFMPDSSDRILDQLAVPKDRRTFAFLNPGEHVTDHNSLVPGTALPKPEGVFPRFVDEETARQRAGT